MENIHPQDRNITSAMDINLLILIKTLKNKNKLLLHKLLNQFYQQLLCSFFTLCISNILIAVVP